MRAVPRKERSGCRARLRSASEPERSRAVISRHDLWVLARRHRNGLERRIFGLKCEAWGNAEVLAGA